MALDYSATKRRRCGTRRTSLRRLSSPISLTANAPTQDKENSASFSFLVGPSNKRTCFRDPQTPMRHLSSNQGFDFTADNSTNGVGSKQSVSRTGSKRPGRVAVTPPSRLLSSFTKNVPLQSKTVSQSQHDDKNPTASDGLDTSMNCSLDCVLDSQIFGLVDELEERNRNGNASEDPDSAAHVRAQSSLLNDSHCAMALGDSIVQQLFTPDASTSPGQSYNGRGASVEHGRGNGSNARCQVSSDINSSCRNGRLQAGLRALESPNLPAANLSNNQIAAHPAATDSKDIHGSEAKASDGSHSSVLSSPGVGSLQAETADLALAMWGLPENVVRQYCDAGVSHLFPWQAECLLQKDVLAGRNLVYSAPTSGGKSLVAELLLLKRVLETRRRAILILPFVSVAREKAKHLQRVFGEVGIRAGAFVGSETPRGGFSCLDVAVCTIERANSLVNRLLEEGRVSELCMLVVDELHMLGDSYRGYLLELLLTKVQFVSATINPLPHHASPLSASNGLLPAIQIVGMSATLPNLPTVARWLRAELYCTDFRPVPLTEYIKAGDAIYDTEMKRVRAVKNNAFKGDDDDMFFLCHESLSAGYGVLVFCPTKARCEKLALALAEMGSKYCPRPSKDEVASLTSVMDQLRSSPVGLDNVLGKVLPYAIAFHHAGLTMEERDILESAFRQQTIRLLVATSTLASGVNLPARRVIIRTPHFHGSLVDVLAYHQMAGRAGRKGLDTIGESFIICKSSEKGRVHSLLTSPLSPVHSCLAGRADSEEGKVAGMQRALLEIIVSRVASTHADIMRYANNTLLAAEEAATALSPAASQASGRSSRSPARRSSGSRGKRSTGRRSSLSGSSLQKTVKAALAFLVEHEFIATRQMSPLLPPGPPAVASQSTTYHSTQLGNATLSSALSPGEALEVFAELQRAQKCFVLENELHVVYQVTPIYLQAQWPGLDWYRFLCLWSKLPPDLQKVGELVGVDEAFLVNAVHGSGLRKAKTAQAKRLQLIHRRFYTALALHDLVHEMPLSEVANKYAASRGLLQSLQQAAATFAGMVTVFCGGLSWHNLQLLLDQFQSRLVFGVERQLCDLLQIKLLDAATARAIYNSNLHSVQAVASADVSTIETILRKSSPFRSSKPQADGAAGVGGRPADSAAIQAKRRYCRSSAYRDLNDAKAAAIIHQEARSLVERSSDVLRVRSVTSDSEGLPPAMKIGLLGMAKSAVVATPSEQQSISLAPDDHRQTTGRALHIPPTPVDSVEATRNTMAFNTSPMPGCAAPGNAVVEPPGRPRPRDSVDRVSKPALPVESLSPADLLVPGDAAAAAAMTHQDDGLANDYSAEELEALAGAMEAGVMSDELFSNTGSVSRPYDGFVSAARLFGSPVHSRKTPPAGANTSNLTESVIAAAGGNNTHSVHSFRSGDSLRFGHSKLICSTPVEGVAAAGQHRRKITGTTTSYSTLSSRPCSATQGSSPVAETRSFSPDLISASMAADPGSELCQISQDLFNEADYQDVHTSDVPALTHGDSEGFDVEPYQEQNGASSIIQAQASPKLVHEDLNDIPVASHESPVKHCDSDGCLDSKRNAESNCARSRRDTKCILNGSLAPATGGVCTDRKSVDLFEDLFNESACDDSLLKEASQPLSLTPTLEKSFCVVDVCGHRRLVRTFLREWLSQPSFAIALASRPYQDLHQPGPSSLAQGKVNAMSIQGNLAIGDDIRSAKQTNFICGISVCWDPSEIYYVSLLDEDGTGPTAADGSVSYNERVRVVEMLLCDGRRSGTLYAFDIKESCRLLSDALSLLIEGMVLDVRSSAWLLNPDGAQQTFAQLLRNELPECCRHGQDNLYYLATTPNRPPRLATAAKASLTWQLINHFKPQLVAADLWTPLVEIESRSALCFARMELCGMGASLDECGKQQQILQQRLSELEEQAFSIVGHSFSLTSSIEVSTVLFHELKLPPDCGSSSTAVTRTRSGRGRRAGQRLQRFSTNKEVLVKLSSLHPLPAIVLEWRRINSALTKVVFPFQHEIKYHGGLKMSRIRCIVQLHTSTGRIALCEPNVQNIPKEFSISVDTSESGFTNETFVSMIRPPAAESSVIAMRDIIVPMQDYILLAADYSQLELRLLAHLSGDPKLCNILQDVSGDAFRSMAAEWLRVEPSEVTAEQRQQAKQVCYGILYGIGAKGLATRLSVDVDAASRFINSFKQTYSVVNQFMESVVKRCRSHGYVTTIGGRRRFLPAIASTSPAARSQAERQAVNTTIQGSAADLVKTAMINIDEELMLRHGHVFSNHHHTSNRMSSSDASPAAFFVLQLHDELMYEVRCDVINEVGVLVQQQMENALSLSVPMPVKLKCGSSWGQLGDWTPQL